MQQPYKTKRPSIGWIIGLLILITVQLACSLSGGSTPAQPTQDVAGTAQAIQGTSQAESQSKLDLQGTEQALTLKGTEMALQSTQSAMQEQPTNEPAPTEKPQPSETPKPDEPTATVDPNAQIDDQIKKAKVLLYEDTVSLGIGEWVEDTLVRMGLDYTATADYSGDFMKYLDSGTKWDLIIIASENHNVIQGEFWDVILEHSQKKTAVIAEVWYLDQYGGGKIKNFMEECGISYDGNWDLAESIYWVKPDHEVFNNPNTALPLLHFNRYWQSNAGDKIRLRAGGDATIVAGETKYATKDEGLIAVCMGGRTVFQTFCNHDYHRSEVMDLWENYITYTLTNHFKAINAQ
jgi:hypothetical protein